MKQFVFILFFISTLNLNAQDFDLIVTTKGDSIACHIDSITATHIYFKMMLNNSWLNTHSPRKNISKYENEAINKNQVIFKPGTSYILNLTEPLDHQVKQFYASKYLFAPSAYPMGKGMKSYTNINVFVQDFQFGISESFSISMGTSIVLNPVYINPSYSFKINNKSAFAVGDLFLFTTYDHIEYGNLLYAIYTRGNFNNNFTIGAGLWISKFGEDNTEILDPGDGNTFTEYNSKIKTTSPAFNFSTQLKLSEHAYFISENYWFKINMSSITELRDNSDNIIRAENYAMKETILAGIFGLRLINKKNNLKSWQLSSIYILAHHGEIPDKYKQEGWETYTKEGGYLFIPLPYITYTIKF